MSDIDRLTVKLNTLSLDFGKKVIKVNDDKTVTLYHQNDKVWKVIIRYRCRHPNNNSFETVKYYPRDQGSLWTRLRQGELVFYGMGIYPKHPRDQFFRDILADRPLDNNYR
jgi:hypothetical protein